MKKRFSNLQVAILQHCEKLLPALERWERDLERRERRIERKEDKLKVRFSAHTISAENLTEN